MKSLKDSPLLIKCSLVLCVVLLLCFTRMPYGFYTLVRFATAIIAGCWAYKFYLENRIPSAVVAAAIVLLFQPFFKVIMDRGTWNFVDLLLAIGLGYLCWKELKD